MLLTDLPPEIHDKIAEHLQPTYSDDGDEAGVQSLKNLALTCSSVRFPAQRTLLSSIKFTLPSDKLQHLLENLRSKPEYGRYVRGVAIEETRSMEPQVYSRQGYGQQLSALALILLARPQMDAAIASDIADLMFLFSTLTNLCRLHVNTLLHHSRGIMSAIMLSDSVPFRSSLEHFEIRDIRTCVPEILIPILTFPRLRTLKVGHLGQGSDPGEANLGNHNLSRSLTLAHLGFYHCQLFLSFFESILSCCPALNSLDCSMPIPADHSVVWGQFDSNSIGIALVSANTPMSMTYINTALSGCKDTLSTLHLNTDKQIWIAHDGTKLNLRSFTALADLSCPSSLFFHPSHFGAERAGFYELLPPSLERFTLTFSPESGIFFPSPHSGWGEEFGRFREKNTYSMNDDMWLRELALNKHSSFPKLHHVNLVDWDQKYSMYMPWEPKRGVHSIDHLDIEDAFRAVNISLRIEMRQPIPDDDEEEENQYFRTEYDGSNVLL